MAADSLERAKAAYAEAVRGVSGQNESRESARSRGLNLFAGGAVATAFFGGEALRDGDASIVALTALILFVAFSLVVGLIVWPWRTRLAAVVLEDIDDDRVTPTQMYAVMAKLIVDGIDDEERRVTRLAQLLSLAIVLLVAEMITWVVDLL